MSHQPPPARRRFNRWAVVALLLVVGFVCQIVFAWRLRVLPSSHAIPDVQFGYTPTDVHTLFQAWNEQERNIYAVTELTVDVVFPLAYGMFMRIILASILPAGSWQRLAYVPVIAAAADIGENVILAYLAWTYDGRESSLVWAAAALTIVKQCTLLATLVMLLFAGLYRLRSAE